VRRLLGIALVGLVALAMPSAAHATFPGTNGKLLYTSSETAIYLWTMNPDGSSKQRIRGAPTQIFDPRFSPDGTRVAYSHYSPDFNTMNIYVMNADGTNITRITATNRNDVMPAWSPDGTKLAFVRDTSIGTRVIIVLDASPNHGPPVQVTPRSGYAQWPDWSPDGSKIAYEDNGILTVHADGTGRTRLVPTSYIASSPTWSPDGTRIAFDSYPPTHGTNAAVWIVRATGTNLHRITPLTGYDGIVRWSPDGTRIAFDNFGVATVKPDGSGLKQLTIHSGDVLGDWGRGS
jgi:Tol biopolymer transport system component